MHITSQDLLLIIDVQNDFCPGGALVVQAGDLVIPVIHRIAPRFEHILLTQDWPGAPGPDFGAWDPKNFFLPILPGTRYPQSTE